MSEHFKCRFCQERFKEVLGFLDHFETHMNQNQMEMDQNDLINEGQFEGDEESKKEPEKRKNDIFGETSDSDEKFTSKNQTQRKLEKELKISNHKCNSCGKSFKQKQNFTKHVKVIHEKVKLFACDPCSKSFGQKGNFERHVKQVHENVKAFNCELCDKCFGYKQLLQTHIATVHENKKAFRCVFCDKNFGQNSDLLRHVKKAHENIKAFKCDSCEKFFARKNNLFEPRSERVWAEGPDSRAEQGEIHQK